MRVEFQTFIHLLFIKKKAPDGKIIIYGGSKRQGTINYARVDPDLIVLNTKAEQFEFTIY